MRQTYIIAFVMIMLNGISSNAQQQYCLQAKLEFTDPAASEAQKAATVAVLQKRIKTRKQLADIRLENGMIVAKMPCNNYEDTRRSFYPDRFAIYETYDISELIPVLENLRRVSDSLQPGLMEQLLDMNFAAGACIGSCRVAGMKQFTELVSLPECRRLLPADLSFVFGIPEEDALAVPVYAVKRTATPPITIGMMKDAEAALSYNKVRYDVLLEFKKEYKATWAALTKKNTDKCLAIMLSDNVLSCPLVIAPIENGKAAISGDMGRKQAEEMAQRINLSLPLEVVITEIKTID